MMAIAGKVTLAEVEHLVDVAKTEPQFTVGLQARVST